MDKNLSHSQSLIKNTYFHSRERYRYILWRGLLLYYLQTGPSTTSIPVIGNSPTLFCLFLNVEFKKNKYDVQWVTE